MISVLVVDDSVVVRRLITDALSNLPEIRVAGTAANGRIALTKVEQLKPDVVTMDIEMPEMDGIAAVRVLRRTHPRLPVIMFSTLSAAGAAATLDALAAGATDYVTKPSNVGSIAASIQAVRDQLVPKIKALGAGRPVPRPVPSPPAAAMRPATAAPPARPLPPPPGRFAKINVIAIGASTGGPDALTRVIAAFPRELPVPVVIVQHMPPVFTRMFAERLNRMAAVRVVEAEDGMPVTAGTVYIAPGDRHLEVALRAGLPVTRLTMDPPENSCRPSVDVLFRSVARQYNGNTLAAVLTGMGADGRRGSELLRAVGAEILAQDEPSSVVWGMPGAVVGAGLAHAVLPLDQIGIHMTTRATAGVARPKVVAP